MDNKVGFKLELWNDKIKITKVNSMLERKTNCGGMYRLIIESVVKKSSVVSEGPSVGVSNVASINVFDGNFTYEISVSSYFVCSISLWHIRLAHTKR